jgi:glutaminase
MVNNPTAVTRPRNWVILAAGVLALGLSAGTPARGPKAARDADYQLAVTQAHKRYASNTSGKVANDVPALAAVSPDLFAVVVTRVDGQVVEAGDSGKTLALTGIGAPFTAALVAEQQGVEALTGTLAAVAGIAPLPNARGAADWGDSPTTALAPDGSLATLALVQPKGDVEAKWRALLDNFSKFSGTRIGLDDAAYRSAQSAAARVQDIARRLAEDGRLVDDAQATSDLFLRQAATAVTTRELSIMAATLANDGVNPVTRHRATRAPVAQNIQQLVALSGVRGGKSSALNKSGLIATASRSGAIIVIVPGRMGIAVYAPPLDSAGVSVRGQLALRYLNQALMLTGDPSKP